jgi:hypothetical protein
MACRLYSEEYVSAGQVVQAEYLARRDLLLAKLALQQRRIGVHLCPHRLAVADGAHDGVLGSFAANTVVRESDDYVVIGDEAAGRGGRPLLGQPREELA